jgi:hypothetical protein
MHDPKSQNETAKRTLKIGALQLRRETLRELDAGELEQAQGGPGSTFKCLTEGCTQRCTRGNCSKRGC